MPRDWFLRLTDILGVIAKVERYIGGLNFESFEKDEKTVDAVVRNLTVIGEAANHIPAEIQERLPQIPWTRAIDLRNFVVHEYFGITRVTIWETAKNRLPELKAEILPVVEQGREAFASLVPAVKRRRRRKVRPNKRARLVRGRRS